MEFNVFDAIQIGLAAPESIRSWSKGEVKKPETINYRTLKPEKEGLFCEVIFGPMKDWECHCGKYKRIRYKGIVCDRCGVEVTKAKVRRERMGHIELAAPVSHIWYFRGIPSRMGLILEMSPKDLEKVLYFAAYVVIDPGKTPLFKKQILSDREYKEAYEKYGSRFKAGMGAEAIKELLAEIDLESLSVELKEELEGSTGQKRIRIMKRLEVVESFRHSNNKPEWMIMDVIPVIPPDIRPMVQLDGGRFATSDLNDLYRRVINRNNRLKKLLELGAPSIIVRNEKRMLQEAVDALIDNGRRGRPVTGPGNRPLKSLSDMLKGKQGRFRQNLLGKRVDYSGRSVIVVGPELKIYQCGLPKEMAIELFKPFVMKRLVSQGLAVNIKNAKRMVERVRPEVWEVLEDVIKEHPVLLNRAPTLHRLGIQAFEPVLVEGRALKLHPLVCTAYNADFDGDQMAIHVPLSAEAQAEARFLMLSANNLLKPQDGKPVTVPTQDMILGAYYLTIQKPKEVKITEPGDTGYAIGDVVRYITEEGGKLPLERLNAQLVAEGKKPAEFTEEKCFGGEPAEGRAFSSVDEAILAYEAGAVGLHAPIKVRLSKEVDGYTVTGLINASVGRIIYNQNVPQDLGFVNRDVNIEDLKKAEAAYEKAKTASKKEALKKEIEEMKQKLLGLEIDFLTGKKQLSKIVNKCIKVHGMAETADVLDKIKSIGYKYSTKGAITISVSDIVVVGEKEEIIQKTEKEIETITKQFRRGYYDDTERHNMIVEEWMKANDEIGQAIMKSLDKYNPIFMMADSGARGSINQIRQLSGMRGIMGKTDGGAMGVPIKANFREGLTVLEFFTSSHGTRKGLADTALRTADSGYLTRRLVDVSQDVIIREDDCGSNEYVNLFDINDGKEIIEELEERLNGRTMFEDVVHPETGEVIIAANEIADDEIAKKIVKAGVKKVKARSVLTCRAKVGVCAKCYGANLTTGKLVNIGEAVGIIAAQSIGEPGTQLTMRTFHTGGAAGGDDITQGLPRVTELFEARKPKPKGLAVMTEIGGKVSIEDNNKTRDVIIENEDDRRVYNIPYGSRIKVADGDVVEKGDGLTDGSFNPHEILEIKGAGAVHAYLVQEVQRVYRMTGVDINDKHIEIIARQMLKKVTIEDSGDSDFLAGSMVDRLAVIRENEALEAEGKKPATYTQELLGITKASLATDSFLSAASFQETTRVLTDAAIKGKIDPLVGLKENVIIGKLIPAGTGVPQYHNVEVSAVMPASENVEELTLDESIEMVAESMDAVVKEIAADEMFNETATEE
ncbi:MAG: DNA-directed RNA polymerase subunit beta' [Clostridia bacterium]|nr:DNA-directed RNA polymerase subunit beta' [Clostridia bacterium]